MSNYGQQPPYGQNPPNPYGQQQPGPYGQPPAGRQPQPPYPGQGPYGQQPGQYPQQQPYGQPGQGPYGQAPQWTPQPPAMKQPAVVQRSLTVVTMETVPGREISSVVGDVVGVVARTRELRPDLRGLNPLDGYVVMLTDSRQDAVARMVEMAVAAGADAVVGLKFDCSEITQSLSEVAAYGTAVKLVPIQDDPAVVGSGEQSSTATESGDQLESEEDTIRN
ncbi:MAG TPA: heavy metal-binding domain-containing protein, partial [Propionibacteriaceae bacterium]|nr:heavy metal-binding domain-containing protein [Propionibacteriaceae bacterium]